jgi:hypothetical protein
LVDLLAGFAHLPLCLSLGLLVLLLRIGAVGLKLLLSLLRFSLGLVGLVRLATIMALSQCIEPTYCCALARTAS